MMIHKYILYITYQVIKTVNCRQPIQALVSRSQTAIFSWFPTQYKRKNSGLATQDYTSAIILIISMQARALSIH